MDDYSDLPLLIPVSALVDYCQCSICMSDMKTTTFTTCGHRFCEDCINDWLKRKHNNCPTCNARLTTANLLKDHQFDSLIETIQAEKEKSATKYFATLINADQSDQTQAAGGRLGNAGARSHLPVDRLRPRDKATADPSVSSQLAGGSECVGKSIRDMAVASSTVVNVPSGWIRGSAFLPDGRLVLADYHNDKLLLLNKLTSKLQLPGRPWDVAVVGNTNVIVTLPWEEKLVYVEVSTTPRTGRTISVGRKCWGVAVVGVDIYVSVHDCPGDGAVLVLDGRGNVRRRIGVDDRGRGKFQYPSYITVGAQGSVYISEDGGGIWCYSNTGHERYHVNHKKIGQPRGILVDRDGNLLVCCNSHEVHVLKPDGALDSALLTQRDGLNGPLSLTYRNTDDTLIVTMEGRPSVRAYKLQ